MTRAVDLRSLPASVRALNPQLPAVRPKRPRKPVLQPGAVIAQLPSKHPATVDPDGTVRAEVPGLPLPSLANLRATWEKAAAVAAARKAFYHVEVFGPRLAGVQGCLVGVPVPPLPLVVTITRVAPRRLDDDNAVAAAKGVRDSVAAWVAVDDRRDDLVRYVVRQERGAPAVRVEVRTVTP